MKKIVEIKNLTKTYGRKGYESVVLKDVTMDIYEHDFIAIMGPSGAGKSTLLNLLSTLDKPSRGQIILDGEDVTRVGNRQLSVIRRDKIGFIFQSYNLVQDLNVYENIVLPIELDGGHINEEFINNILSLLKLTEKREALPCTLSGGQQQRVAIARALASKPAIVLADEPTGNLDTATSHDVLGLLRVVAKQYRQTIILITHDQDIAQLADRIVRIEDGRIVKGSSVDD